MQRLFLGFDTSCYTSSAACIDLNGILRDERIVLSVADGERGLRQSDAVFQHTRNLEKIIPPLLESIDTKAVSAVGVSSCPSGRENSYMPVFLSGKMAASAVAAALGVPLHYFTHQQGHIRAALYGNEDLIGKKFVAFHLSGGTTDILEVTERFEISRVGGSTDINAGQLVDRIGVKLGLHFPAGKSLEEIAARFALGSSCSCMLPSSVRGFNCSFSGIETKAAGFIDSGVAKEHIAIAIYDCIARTISKLIKNISLEREVDSFLLAGGVASSSILREMLAERLRGIDVNLFFAKTELASDNSVGIALLAMDSTLNLL